MIYIKRKISKGQTPKDRLEWKQASEYWTKESPVARGNNFNKTVREADIYDTIHFLRREMLDFTAFSVFFVSNLLLVQRKKYYFNRATVSRNCSIVL